MSWILKSFSKDKGLGKGLRPLKKQGAERLPYKDAV
jgi:hypothetical protein